MFVRKHFSIKLMDIVRLMHKHHVGFPKLCDVIDIRYKCQSVNKEDFENHVEFVTFDFTVKEK